MLVPSYGEGVEEALDKIESDGERRPLWSAIVTAIDLICDQPDSAEARRYALHVKTNIAWRIPIRVGSENQDWTLIWAPDGDQAVVLYVGQWPPAN